MIAMQRVSKKMSLKTEPVCALQVDMADPVHQRQAFLKLKKIFPI
jgi:hypothetical protein